MNVNDVAVSVIFVEDANKLVVKIDRPPTLHAIDEAIEKTVAAAGRPPKHYFHSSKEVMGQLVLAKLTHPDAPANCALKYRRAVVRSLNSVKIMEVFVDFVDDGIYYQSMPYSSLLPCPESIKHLDTHAKTLHLKNINAVAWQPSLNHATGQVISNQVESVVWSPAAKYHVSDIFRTCPGNCKAEVFRTDADGCWHGDLHFLRNGCYNSLRKELIDHQFAKEVRQDVAELPQIPFSPTNALPNPPIENKNSFRHANSPSNLYFLTGSKPHPKPKLDAKCARDYDQLVRRLHDFHPTSYHDFVWSGVFSARNLFITMPPDQLIYDENAITLVLPTLAESIVRETFSGAQPLQAIFIVPSGIDGSKLTKQLEAPRLGLPPIKFLYSTSTDGDASNCQILVLTPSKLNQFLRAGPSALKMDALRFLAFMFVDEMVRSDDDRQILLNFKAEFNRFQHLNKQARLFGLSKGWSKDVAAFFNSWFSNASPLVYFLDLVEASLSLQVKFSFANVSRDALPRILLEHLKRFQREGHRIAILVPDDQFDWLLQWLKSSNVMSTRAIAPELAGLHDQMMAEFNDWKFSPTKQCLLLPDSLLRPEVGLFSKSNRTIGATTLLHLISIKDKELLRARFQLMKPSWNQDSDLQCENVFLLESLPRDMCNFMNDLLERAGVGKQDIITNWGMKSKVLPKTAQLLGEGDQEISKRAEIGLELCPQWLETGGRCVDEALCRWRHSIKREHDDCASESKSKWTSLEKVGREGGRISVQIQSVVSGSHFVGVLKFPVNSTIAIAKIDHMLRSCIK